MNPTSDQQDPLHLITGTAGRILNCAQELIRDRGYNGFSYADIATVIGIRKASIHHHYPAKAMLGQAVMARYAKDTIRAITALDAGRPNARERLIAFAEYWEQGICAGGPAFCLGVQLASELPALPLEVADEVKLYFRSLTEWVIRTLETGAREGSIRLLTPAPAEANCLIAAIHGALISARVFGVAPGECTDNNQGARIFATIAGEQLRRLLPPSSQ